MTPEEYVTIHGFKLPATERHFQGVLKPPRDNTSVYGVYQYERLKEAAKLCKQRRVALDVGGHVGLWAKHLCRCFDQVTSFEPNSKLIPYYEENMIEELRAEKAVLRRLGLGDKQEVLEFVYVPDCTGNSHVREPGEKVEPENLQRMTVERLDNLELENVDFIKIDCEGYEEFVVRGAEQLIKRDKPVIVVEQKAKYDGNYGTEKQSAAKLLLSWGMKKHAVRHGDWIMKF